MKFLKLLKYAAVLIISFAFISCNNAVPVNNQELSGRTFSLISPEKNEQVEISFQDRDVFGNAGVNRFFGTFDAKDNTITFGPLGSTMMAGPDEAMKLESEIHRILASSAKVTLDDGVLTITSKDGKVLKYREVVKK